MQEKRKKYEGFKFDLKDCEVSINIVEKHDDKGFGIAFLNIKLPDGRWVCFETPSLYRVPLYKKEETK